MMNQPIISERIMGLRAIDAANKDLMERNAIRLAAFKESMGKKYLLHPENQMTKEKFVKITRVVTK